jgi:hypothetical protein
VREPLDPVGQIKLEHVKRKTTRSLAPCVPSKFNLFSMVLETRHLFSNIMELRDQMPRSQKDTSGICTFIVQYADRALYLAILIDDYGSKDEREKKLREYNIALNHLKELIITAHERGYIPKRSTLDRISTKIIELSDKAIAYAMGLEKKLSGAEDGGKRKKQ